MIAVRGTHDLRYIQLIQICKPFDIAMSSLSVSNIYASTVLGFCKGGSATLHNITDIAVPSSFSNSIYSTADVASIHKLFLALIKQNFSFLDIRLINNVFYYIMNSGSFCPLCGVVHSGRIEHPQVICNKQAKLYQPYFFGAFVNNAEIIIC